MAHDARDSLASAHGSKDLHAVAVDCYNAELRDGEGFLGDRANNRAFRDILDGLRAQLVTLGEADPLGPRSSRSLSKRKLDQALVGGDPLAGGLVLTAVEEFAHSLATVTTRLLKTKAWKGTERIVVGGGLRQSRVGELAIGRAAILVKAAGFACEILPIRHHPDEAGLIGTTQLPPPHLYREANAMLAIDIGGSNIRAGVVEMKDGRAKCVVRASELWRHAAEPTKPKRGEVIDRVGKMLRSLVKAAAKESLVLMPVIGVGCPGVIESDASIDRGAQNLPGNWESARFNLASELAAELPRIGGEDTRVIVHNDAVVQGLSEAPFMRDVEQWGVLTIGTGLGNARFTNRPLESVRERAPWSPTH